MKNLSWLILVNKYEYLAQVNRNGLAYISKNRGNLSLDFSYRITPREAKKKFPQMTRNEFAERILSGEELITEDWG